MRTLPAPAGVGPLAGVLAELCDLKRVHVAGAKGSLAGRAFLRSWAAVVAGEPLAEVARRETAAAVMATRLSGIDAGVLRAGGLDDATVAGLSRDALRDALGGTLAALLAPAGDDAPLGDAAGAPRFARLLAAQPRAGATAPGRRRLVLVPAETHAEHCFCVAAGAALLAAHGGEDLGVPFLAGLAHHLHNATLPDAGFAGETLLGEHLEEVVEAHRRAALRELDHDLAARAATAAGLALRLDTTAARAVVAADVLDRVLELDWHARAAGFTLDRALDDLELVHPGPLQEFGEATLREAGLR